MGFGVWGAQLSDCASGIAIGVDIEFELESGVLWHVRALRLNCRVDELVVGWAASAHAVRVKEKAGRGAHRTVYRH